MEATFSTDRYCRQTASETELAQGEGGARSSGCDSGPGTQLRHRPTCDDKILPSPTGGYSQKNEPQSLFDVGTGSGILAIAAAKLGYQPIRAIDFDSEAVRVAKENIKRNHVTQTVKTSLSDVSKLSLKPRVKFDVVCANLFFDLLMANAGRLIAQVKPGGVLVLAGILDEQFVEVKTVFENSAMKLKHTGRRGEWHSGTFVHAG